MHVFQKILVRIAQELDRSQLPYMIIGRQAVLLYGEPRATKDIDITLGADNGKLDTVRTIVGKLGMSLAVAEAEAFVQRYNMLPVVDEESGIRYDVAYIELWLQEFSNALGRGLVLEFQQLRRTQST